MLELYCGDGKGKTTACVGLAVRAAGHDIPVIFAQFMKNNHSGEITILQGIPQIQVMHTEVFYGFVKDMNTRQKEEMKLHNTKLVQEIERKIRASQQEFMVVILDEVLHACHKNLLDETLLYHLLDACTPNIEIVFSGKHPSKELCRRADYISEIHKIKHPFDQGIAARKGIEL
ncbi:MAG: cob(I)yrinic acid a,c-diamide adenosyltransferase [Lachnospiraceae bacterium]